MSYGRLLIALLIATAPGFAGAQRGAGNIRGDRAGNVGGRGFALPRSSDLEDHSPVGVVLERKKKLALSECQVTALKAIAKQLHDQDAEDFGGKMPGGGMPRGGRPPGD